MAQIAFRQDPIHSPHHFINSFDPFDDNLPEPNDFLRKTKFFSRIGIGLKTMLSIPLQRRQSITSSLNQNDSREEPQSCEQSPKPGCPQLKCDESFEEKLRENVQRARKDTNSKLSAILSIKRKSYSEDFIAFQTQERCIENYEESMKKFESVKGTGQAAAIKRAVSETVEDSSLDFFAKTDHQMRTCYYNRLIQMRILKPTPSKKNQNIIIFDWDDTLLCTSYLIALGIKSAAPTILSVLKPVDDIASKLLNKSTDLGQVFIITNAEHGWVQSSARNFLPKTYAVIEKASITVISARACYEDEFPGDNERWKKEAFTSLSKMFEKDIITNLICIGDSDAEINAAHFLAKEFNSAIIKTIKFKEKPKPEELTKQHCLVLDKFDKLFVSLRNSTIRLERKHI